MSQSTHCACAILCLVSTIDYMCFAVLQSIHCACAILGQVNDLLGNKFKSAVLTRLSGALTAAAAYVGCVLMGMQAGCRVVRNMWPSVHSCCLRQLPAAVGLACTLNTAFLTGQLPTPHSHI
jgi:hypothetical protein